MTREEAQIIIGNIPIYGDDCYTISEYQEAKAMAIEALEAQRWIPVRERLPEEDSDILVTYVEKDEKRIIPVNYGRGTWFDCIFDRALNPINVLAWMPLPEPYTERWEE